MKKKSVVFDVLLNYLSLLIGGISGICINLYVAYSYGPEGLGVFSQIYAFYVILSQLSVCGVHLSAFKHVTMWKGSSANLSKIAWSSFLLSLPISSFCALFCYISSFLMEIILPGTQVAQGIRYASLALIFFSCNKVLLFTLNALQEMKLLAFWQGMRFMLMIFFIIVLIHFNNSASTLGLAFTFSESVLFVGLLLTNLYKLPYFYRGLNINWIKRHLTFGLRGCCNGLFLEINTRVDVLILGVLATDVTVGLYSFASMLIEGIVGFLVVIRNQINPILADLLKHNKKCEIKILFKKISFYIYFISLLLLSTTVFFYDYLFSFLPGLSAFIESRNFFLILLCGVCLYSAYFIFENILMLSGHPGKQSLLAFYATLTNIILNICFIIICGPYGAAWATSFTMLLSIFYFRSMVKKYLSFQL